MSRSGKASAFAALAASAAAGWARLHARERRLVLLAAAVVLNRRRRAAREMSGE